MVTSFPLPTALIPLESPYRFRRAWRHFRFGNIHSPGGASCQDCGGFLPPPGFHSPSLTSFVVAVST
jgi:hypothetical protein